MSKSEKLAWSLVGMFVGMPVTWVIRGYVLAKLWLWFVASQFGLPALNIPQAIGAGMLLNLVTHHYTKPADDEPVGAPLVRSLILSMFALGIGAIVSLFL